MYSSLSCSPHRYLYTTYLGKDTFSSQSFSLLRISCPEIHFTCMNNKSPFCDSVFGLRRPNIHSSRSHSWIMHNALCPPHRACLGQCFSYSVPNTFPQSTESLVHCDSCMPAQTQWEVVRFMAHQLIVSTHQHKLV